MTNNPIGDEVLHFYESLPFNYMDSLDNEINRIKERDLIRPQVALHPILKDNMKIMDLGCGIGWLANSLAFHYGLDVTAVDFNRVALDRARKVSESLQINVNFICADILQYIPATPFDIVCSLGVLHHTGNMKKAFEQVCNLYLAKNGYFFLGLYHSFGRRPFLEYFDNLKDSGASEKELFDAYAELHSSLKNPVLLKSWFRDQVLHPHETSYTLKEIIHLAELNNMKLEATSINHFNKIAQLSDLFSAEKAYEELSREKLQQKQYFPGYFTVLLKKIH